MGNCGGHEFSITLDRVRTVLLPGRSTAKHQPLELGAIVQAKIRYRSTLLSAVLNVMETRRDANRQFRSDSVNGNYGIAEGNLPNVADAMSIFNDAWSNTYLTSSNNSQVSEPLQIIGTETVRSVHNSL